VTSGVYAISNFVTWQIYVGSSINVQRRFHRHLNDLRRGNHVNLQLQTSFNNYGESSFNFIELINCSVEEARRLEQKFLYDFCGKPFCFNNAKMVGEINTGRKLSEEHKRKIGQANSIALKGRKLSTECKKKIGIASKNRIRNPHSDATKLKMRLAKLGKPAPWNSYPRGSDWGKRTVAARWKKEGKKGYIGDVPVHSVD
jgi:group I intron endonuclease